MIKIIKIIILASLIIGCGSPPIIVKRDIDLDKLVELHNESRAKWGYGHLHKTDNLTKYANDHANFMLKNKKLKHSSMSNVLDLGYSNVGENIAWNQQTEEEVINSWLWSPGHRSNILSKNYDSIGCGVAYDDKNVYWCVVFGRSD
jgi:uncharacterized protein YkwD